MGPAPHASASLGQDVPPPGERGDGVIPRCSADAPVRTARSGGSLVAARTRDSEAWSAVAAAVAPAHRPRPQSPGAASAACQGPRSGAAAAGPRCARCPTPPAQPPPAPAGGPARAGLPLLGRRAAAVRPPDPPSRLAPSARGRPVRRGPAPGRTAGAAPPGFTMAPEWQGTESRPHRVRQSLLAPKEARGATSCGFRSRRAAAACWSPAHGTVPLASSCPRSTPPRCWRARRLRRARTGGRASSGARMRNCCPRSVPAAVWRRMRPGAIRSGPPAPRPRRPGKTARPPGSSLRPPG